MEGDEEPSKSCAQTRRDTKTETQTHTLREDTETEQTHTLNKFSVTQPHPELTVHGRQHVHDGRARFDLLSTCGEGSGEESEGSRDGERKRAHGASREGGKGKGRARITVVCAPRRLECEQGHKQKCPSGCLRCGPPSLPATRKHIYSEFSVNSTHFLRAVAPQVYLHEESTHS